MGDALAAQGGNKMVKDSNKTREGEALASVAHHRHKELCVGWYCCYTDMAKAL